jgi:diguanylate cyclase (GGDEF)-like protein/PAS domain S-box-containing protein
MEDKRVFKVSSLALISMLMSSLAFAVHVVSIWPQRPGLLAASLWLAALLPAAMAGWRAWRDNLAEQSANRQLISATDRLSHGDLISPIDVVSPKGAELSQALERMRLALRQTTFSRNYLYSVLNSMSDAVFVSAPDGAIRVVNEAALRLTGYAETELLQLTVVALLDNRGEGHVDSLQQARDTGEAVLRTRSGQTIPVSFVMSTISTDDAQFAGDIYVARDITERKRAERRIRYLARYDALTKIPNRMQFQHLLQQSIARQRRTGREVALLYIDMDRFKEVNDTFGHAAGDRVLEALTERLTRVLSSDAVLGRLAGDEFALFIDGVEAGADEARAQVVQLARMVIDAAGSAFHIDQHEVFLSVSIGIASCPHDADNVIDLIRNADAAMYYAKQNGGNSYAVYSQEMNAAAVERLMLKSKLRRAIERDEFVVHYQPKVDLRDGRIIGAEALLRWRVPGHGDIPPSQFIPLAEENNLIDAIGEWVLERVCVDLVQLRRAVGSVGRIALNLSLKQLRQAGFILKCHAVFERHSVSPQSIELEITETTLMANPQRTVQMLNQLAAMGLHLSVDDFGTGYSSLSALQQFPIDTLKIDQSFVQKVADDPADATLVKTIIDMGHGLGMEVVAEGVETVAQLEFVRANGCNHAQGTLFGEPMAVQSLLLQLKGQQGGRAAFADLISNVAARSVPTAEPGRLTSRE